MINRNFRTIRQPEHAGQNTQEKSYGKTRNEKKSD